MDWFLGLDLWDPVSLFAFLVKEFKILKFIKTFPGSYLIYIYWLLCILHIYVVHNVLELLHNMILF